MNFPDLNSIEDKHYIEQMHVVAITYPHFSKKYRQFVTCLAGLTKKDEWRRIYPVPAKWIAESGIQKGDEVEYRIRNEHPEHRYESRKIYTETLKLTNSYSSVKMMSFHIETLKQAIEADKSITVIKPLKIIDIGKRGRKLLENTKSKRDFYSLDLPLFYPSFLFQDNDESVHKTSCEDMQIIKKGEWALSEYENAIFIMGTHYLFNTWLIISIINC